jgi:hypothetical protein
MSLQSFINNTINLTNFDGGSDGAIIGKFHFVAKPDEMTDSMKLALEVRQGWCN